MTQTSSPLASTFQVVALGSVRAPSLTSSSMVAVFRELLSPQLAYFIAIETNRFAVFERRR